MNELEFLRSQMRLERTHCESQRALLGRSLQAVAAAEPARDALLAAAHYLVFALRREARRDRLHADQTEARLAVAQVVEADQRKTALAAVARLRAEASALAAAIETLAVALQAPATAAVGDSLRTACTAFEGWATNFKPAGREALEPWFERLYAISDWRQVALTDAESVFEERRLHEAANAAARAAGLLA
jgi:hypothetical protein